jgi:hypothetical protein
MAGCYDEVEEDDEVDEAEDECGGRCGISSRAVSFRRLLPRPRKDKRSVDLISDALPFRSAVVWRSHSHARLRNPSART